MPITVSMAEYLVISCRTRPLSLSHNIKLRFPYCGCLDSDLFVALLASAVLIVDQSCALSLLVFSGGMNYQYLRVNQGCEFVHLLYDESVFL